MVATADHIATSGKLSEDATNNLQGKYASCLYLATDAGTDKGVEPTGFVALASVSGVAARHVPVDVKNGLSLELAQAAMTALDELSGNALVVCNSGGRASAVKAMRKALEAGWTRDQVLAYAQEEKLPFLGNANLKDWVLATVAHAQYKAQPPLIFRPLFEETSWTYTYLLACPTTKEAILIDPVDLTVDRDMEVLEQLGLTLVAAVNTHCHADHITGSGLLARKVPGCKSMIAAAAGADATVKLQPGDRVQFGQRFVEARATPGHTDGCMSFLTDDYTMVFTGDALLIRGCGRTDFQQGSPDKLYDSIHTQIFSLPRETLVYPGHDYKGRLMSTVGEEKTYNPRLAGTSREAFAEIMHNLNLPYPKKIDASLPSNKVDGLLGH